MELTREQLKEHLQKISEAPRAEIFFAYRDAILAHDQAQREKLAAYEKDMEAARGELGVSLEESPIGSLVAKLVMANRVLRSERSNLQAQLQTQEAALADDVWKAHVPVTGTQHDPANGLLHGYCARCRRDWPCEWSPESRTPSLKQQLATAQATIANLKAEKELWASNQPAVKFLLDEQKATIQRLTEEVSELRDLEAQTQHWIGDVATEMLGYQYREISLGKLRELLQQRLATLEGALEKLRFLAVNYQKSDHPAGAYQCDYCKQYGAEAATVRHMDSCPYQALAPAPGGQSVDANKMVEGTR